MRRCVLAVGVCALVSTAARGVNIYVLSSGDSPTDQAALFALTSNGHTATLGVPYTAFDGTQNLSGFQTVYLQANFNWAAGDMPVSGQQALVNWVNAGGRLVTSEWVGYNASAGGFQVLGPILPLEPSLIYGDEFSTTYTQDTADPTLNAGLPTAFGFPLESYAGTELFTTPRAGARSFYSTSSSTGDTGLAGWARGSGVVYSFTSTCGPLQLTDPNFSRLFGNVMAAGGPAPCYANCDGSTGTPALNVNDFVCFQTRFAAADPYADCDQSASLNVNDFVCFQTRFAAGCR